MRICMCARTSTHTEAPASSDRFNISLQFLFMLGGLAKHCLQPVLVWLSSSSSSPRSRFSHLSVHLMGKALPEGLSA